MWDAGDDGSPRNGPPISVWVLLCEYVLLRGWGQIEDKDQHKESKPNLLLLKTKKAEIMVGIYGASRPYLEFPKPTDAFISYTQSLAWAAFFHLEKVHSGFRAGWTDPRA